MNSNTAMPRTVYTLCNGKKRADFVKKDDRYVNVYYYKANAQPDEAYTYAKSKAQITWENLVNDGYDRIV